MRDFYEILLTVFIVLMVLGITWVGGVGYGTTSSKEAISEGRLVVRVYEFTDGTREVRWEQGDGVPLETIFLSEGKKSENTLDIEEKDVIVNTSEGIIDPTTVGNPASTGMNDDG